MTHNDKQKTADVLIVGGGAAGLMCALTAGQRGRRVVLLEHNKSPGAKILISGGGRCNFTNIGTHAGCFISENPHFIKSALAGYGPEDFLGFLRAHDLTWHEKTLGQLFCDQKAQGILSALLKSCQQAGVQIINEHKAKRIRYEGEHYSVETNMGSFKAPALVMASGGLSIPKLGASDFSYRIAKQFGLEIIEPKPALVPLTFSDDIRQATAKLAGVSQPSRIRADGPAFEENLLFTHRGLSGPAVLQASSYWDKGSPIYVDMLPSLNDFMGQAQRQRQDHPKQNLTTFLTSFMATRLATHICRSLGLDGNMADQSNKNLTRLEERLKRWSITPAGDEGFAKAEVTRGGVDTKALNQKTMEVKSMPGLYFIGECVDVTGWLGGYNFQWAWASGVAAGRHI